MRRPPGPLDPFWGSRDHGRVAGWSAGWWSCRWGLSSAARGRERLEFLKRGDELARPRPCVLQVELGAPAGEREPRADMQQPVAQALGLGFGELALERQRLRPDDQIVREQHDLQPHLVEREFLERELGKAGVLVVADSVLDMGALAVAVLEHRDVLLGLVGAA